MHFNALFFIYCVVFLASTFTLIDLVSTQCADHPDRWHDGRAPIRLVAVTWFGIAGIFASMWLSQIIPALMRGGDPAGLADVRLVANPVHVLDLALVLPAMVVIGVGLLRNRPLCRMLAPILLSFTVAMALAICTPSLRRASRASRSPSRTTSPSCFTISVTRPAN